MKHNCFIQRLSSYHTVNTHHLSYTDQSVTAVQGKSHCLFWNPYKRHECAWWAEHSIFEC